MKIFSAAQIRACDAYTIHAGKMESLDLMERAAAACTDKIMQQYGREQPFIVLCGMGNNGGDGLAIARMLHKRGYGVKAFVLKYGAEFSGDCHANLQRLLGLDNNLVSLMEPGTFIADIAPHIVIVDAIFGTGLNRQPQDWIGSVIHQINDLPNKKISIDLPSGLSSDHIPDHEIVAIRADQTLSFQFYKRAFLHPETGVFAGKVHVLDIGLNATFIESTHTHYYVMDRDKISAMLRPRNPFTHKGTCGTALLAAGSYGMMGAALLAVKAAARTGAGKVVARIPSCGLSVIQSTMPEAVCSVSGERYIQEIGGVSADAIGIGPGLGTDEITVRAFTALLGSNKQPLVLDADALNILAKHPDLLGKLPPGSILTPHPKEFERLFGKTNNSMMQVEQARFQAMRYNCIIVLKGRYTAIATPDGSCWYNPTGNAGMATGGSGDVLTGMITALLAQGYSSEEAALIGVYVHGLAGDLALEQESQESLIASDIIDHIGAAFQSLHHPR